MRKAVRLALPDFEAFAKATMSLGVGLAAGRRQPLAIKAARAACAEERASRVAGLPLARDLVARAAATF
eukprot:4582704-Alexandrium_andersonii.AAC.1